MASGAHIYEKGGEGRQTLGMVVEVVVVSVKLYNIQHSELGPTVRIGGFELPGAVRNDTKLASRVIRHIGGEDEMA